MSGVAADTGSFAFTVRVTDNIGAYDEKTFVLKILPVHLCGDANGDGAVNIGDGVAIINYVFRGGQSPEPMCAGDANNDGDVNIGDAVYLIAYVFNNGPPPVETCCW